MNLSPQLSAAGSLTTRCSPRVLLRGMTLTLAFAFTTALFALPGVARAEACPNEALRTELNSGSLAGLSCL